MVFLKTCVQLSGDKYKKLQTNIKNKMFIEVEWVRYTKTLIILSANLNQHFPKQR
jgi:hypothetical protein